MGFYYTGMKISLRLVTPEAAGCRLCKGVLEPRPVFRVGKSARLLVVGQAPGRRGHETGIPWNDPSGDALRGGLAVDREAFYDTARIAVVPIGLCYPGTVEGADLPPVPRCAPLWQPKFRAALPNLALTLLVGSYAQKYCLGARRKRSLSETVQASREY